MIIFNINRNILFLLLFYCLIPLQAFNVDAGEDQIICNGNMASVEIGGSPTALGSTSPNYTYSWNNAETLSCSDCPNPIASPTETTFYEVTVIDGGGFVCTDEVEVAILFLELYPKDVNFLNDADKKGRVLISTFHDASYYTVTPSAIGDLPAQHEALQNNLPPNGDGKCNRVKITAHITPAEEAVGKTVYFRTVVPDPKDPSSYYVNNGITGNDNKDKKIKMGKLDNQFGMVSATVSSQTINGKLVGAAEVELTITDQHAGDNYQVEAALDVNFNNCPDRTDVLTAWKRVYVATTGMYEKGAVLVESKPNGDETVPYELKISSNSGLKKGDKIIIYGFDALSSYFEIERTILTKSGTKITVNGINTFLKTMTGIRLKNDVDGIFNHLNFSQFHPDGLLKTYGKQTGGVDGGAFVEFLPYTGDIGFIPPLYATIPSEPLAGAYLKYWKKTTNPENIVLLIGASRYTGSNASGLTWEPTNNTLIFKKNIDDFFALNPSITVANKEDKLLAQIVSHEMGHQHGVNKLLFSHVDKKGTAGQVHCHEGSASDYCSMSYANDIFNDSIIEFALDVIEYIRSFKDPI